MVQPPSFNTKKIRSIKPFERYSTECTIKLPQNCPHCGVIVDGTPTDGNIYGLEQGGGAVAIVLLRCTNCQRIFAAVCHLPHNGKCYDFVFCYPSPSFFTPDPVIQSLSPRFVDLYKQVLAAENAQCLDLAAVGMRTAIEVLVKDYALEGVTDEAERKRIANLKLEKALAIYLDESGMLKSADVVRMLANDYAHYAQKYEQHGFDTLKEYFSIFLSLITVKIKAKHPPVARPPQP